LLETFFDRQLFHGAKYKAADWELVGETKGRGQNDHCYEYALSVNDIYMYYPLRQDFHTIPNDDKPYKAVNPTDIVNYQITVMDGTPTLQVLFTLRNM